MLTTHQLTRLRIAVRERRPEAEAPTRRVLLVHGNVSTSVFFEPLIDALPADWHIVASDLRGFGATEPKPIDGTRGLRDFSDDLAELSATLGWTSDVHALGWSVGGGVVMQLAIDHPGLVASLTLVAPVPPRGFGGTHGPDGEPNAPDFAGSGGSTVSPAFVAAIAKGDRGGAITSPRTVLKTFLFNPERFTPKPEQEEAYVDVILTTRTGIDHCPGDGVPSRHWLLVAPGTRGIANAFSAKYLDLRPFADLTPKPRVLWLRGDKDAIVGDASLFDLAQLGKLGVVPAWPGAATAPPQPMIAQTRTLLNRYRANGGDVRELVLEGAGHTPTFCLKATRDAHPPRPPVARHGRRSSPRAAPARRRASRSRSPACSAAGNRANGSASA